MAGPNADPRNSGIWGFPGKSGKSGIWTKTWKMLNPGPDPGPEMANPDPRNSGIWGGFPEKWQILGGPENMKNGAFPGFGDLGGVPPWFDPH